MERKWEARLDRRMNQPAFPGKGVLRATKKSAKGEFVISDGFGKPIHSVKRAFQSARKRAGLPDVRVHDLRHTFASRLINSGVPDRIVQKLLGHSTPGMTLRYTHPSEEALRRAVATLSDRSASPIYPNVSLRKNLIQAGRLEPSLRESVST